MTQGSEVFLEASKGPPEHRRPYSWDAPEQMNGATLRSTRTYLKLVGALMQLVSALMLLPSLVFAQAKANENALQSSDRPWNIGVLAQGGFGTTDRSDFRFFSAGIGAGKVLTPTVGSGMLRGNFEYRVQVFPLWQSYTPKFQRQNCTPIPAQPLISCSAPFTVGGTFTGVSITPILLRWNFVSGERWSPWIQGGGGVIWTNHKYPAVGGPPVNNGGVTNSSIGNNGSNQDTSVWNFTPQFGIGTHYFLRPNRSIDFGANAVHISSSSLGDKNPGVNASVQFTVGYSWWK